MREESLLTPVIAEQRNIAFIYITITTHPAYFGPKNVLLFPPPPHKCIKKYSQTNWYQKSKRGSTGDNNFEGMNKAQSCRQMPRFTDNEGHTEHTVFK